MTETPEPRTCQECGIDLPARTRADYCRKNDICRKLAVAHISRLNYKRRPPSPKRQTKIDRWTIPDDDYIDPVSIYLAVNGIRDVRLTPQERMACLEKMLGLHIGPGLMQSRLRLGYPQLCAMLDSLGWEIIRDPHVSATQSRLLVRKDRSKAKILTKLP